MIIFGVLKRGGRFNLDQLEFRVVLKLRGNELQVQLYK